MAVTDAPGRLSVTTANLEYLQRSGTPVEEIGSSRTIAPARAARRIVSVRGIGRRDKVSPPPSQLTAEPWRIPTEDLLAGLYGYKIPMSFSVTGGDENRIQLGIWSARAGTAQTMDRRGQVLASLIRGLYPVVRLEPGKADVRTWPLSGFALGIPTAKRPTTSDAATPIDRVLRSMAGTEWSAVVVAHPVGERAINDMRHEIINEMRVAETSAKNEAAPSPLIEHYVQLLTTSLKSLTEASSVGGWRAAVYLLGDGESYPRLASVWRSVFSGVTSVPETVRVFDAPEAAKLAARWAMPDTTGAAGPGFYQRRFEHQTLLTSTQLAAYVHFPDIETPGFSLDLIPTFDAVPAVKPSEAESISLGTIVQGAHETTSQYRISLRSLTRHVLVAGVTGAGKTNTVLSLLSEADAAGVPFLVVEPSKTEYRRLIDHPKLGKRLRIFTAGDEATSRFRLNPFEVPLGIPVSHHLDLLRAVFEASFGMWTPLPQVLERCLHAIYADRGWDLRTNTNRRLSAREDTFAAYPTLTDLVAKVHEVVPQLGYEDKIAGDLRAALTTRLESLRTGGKGAMLDVARSLPMEELFSHPAVLELEPMGDEGDKAFLMGLVLIRLVEHRRGKGQSENLVHLLVVEEAHRLLANTSVQGASDEMTANPKGQAVETFANLLSEIRAYGQGVIIADQVPVRLAPDAIKNTNLKLAHRVVAADDRAALAGSMGMDEQQARALQILGVGKAATFSEGDDAPMIVHVPEIKDGLGAIPPDNAKVGRHMDRWRSGAGLDDVFLPQPFCAESCRTEQSCRTARGLMEDEFVWRTLSRVVLSMIADAAALDRMWDDVIGAIRARRSVGGDEDDVLLSVAGHGAFRYASQRGAQADWPYSSTVALSDSLRRVLTDKVAGRPGKKARNDFRTLFEKIHRRSHAPYPACHLICTQKPAVCLYRSAVAELVATRRYRQSWRDADATDALSEDDNRERTWQICQDAGYELIEFPEKDWPAAQRVMVSDTARRVCLCFEQQMLADDERKVPRTSRMVMGDVLREAGV